MGAGKIAIVDDEKDLSLFIHEYLTEAGFESSFFTSPFMLLDQMAKEKFKIIFSDLKMPEKSGLDLFNSIVAMDIQDPPKFVLMSGHIQGNEIKSYYQQGIDEVILKPFDLNDIVTVTNLLMENGVVDEVNSHAFFPLPINEFINPSGNKYDVYVKIDDKYICVAKKGQPLTQFRLGKLQQKGLSQVFLTQEDFLIYSDIQLKLTDSTTLTRLDIEKKNVLVNHLIEVVSTSAMLPTNRNELLQKAISNLENVGFALSLNSKVMSTLSKLKNSNNDLLARSTVQGVLAAAVAQSWKWNSPKIQSKLIMAGLLCDIGLREIPQLSAKKRHEYDPSDIVNYESHPERSAKILESIPGMPHELLLIAKQHHENEIGKGFPYRLKKEVLHPYSRIMHVVSDFLDILTSNLAMDHEKAMSEMFQRRIQYSEQVLKGLYLALGVTMPSRITSVQMPDKTTTLI